jgi:hypothetical protein
MAETQQFSWALELKGDRLDMDDALALFGSSAADPTIREVGNEGSPLLALTSPQMEALSTDQEVEGVAKRLLGIVNGVLFVSKVDRQPLVPGGVMKRTSNGWAKFAGMVAHGRGGGSAEGMALVDGKPSPQTRAERRCLPARY